MRCIININCANYSAAFRQILTQYFAVAADAVACLSLGCSTRVQFQWKMSKMFAGVRVTFSAESVRSQWAGGGGSCSQWCVCCCDAVAVVVQWCCGACTADAAGARDACSSSSSKSTKPAVGSRSIANDCSALQATNDFRYVFIVACTHQQRN